MGSFYSKSDFPDAVVCVPRQLPEEWHCPYCDYGEYKNRDDWERRAADHVDTCYDKPAASKGEA